MARKREMSNRRAGHLGILLFLALGAKFLVIVITGVICGLVSSISPEIEVGVIIICAVLTIAYIIISILISMGILCRCPQVVYGCDIVEAISCLLFLCYWLASCGISITVSLKDNTNAPEQFAWTGACCGLNAALFLALIGLFCVRSATHFIYK